MKSVLFCAFNLLLSSSVFSQGIVFEEIEWADALNRAKAEDKLIFLDAMTQWSQPCKIIQTYAYEDPQAGQFFNDNFINLQFDMEGFPGVELAERYQVYLYPTQLFIDGEGVVRHRGCGAMDATDLIALGKEALSDENISTLQKEYDDGNRDPDFLARMSTKLEEACLDNTAWMEYFFSELPRDEWTGEAAWTMINLNVNDPFSQQFQYLMKYHDLYALKYGKDTVDQKIYTVLLNQFTEIYEGEDLTLFAIQALKSIMNPLNFNKKNELEAMVDLQYSEEVEDWDLYCQSAVKVVEEQEITDPEQLNEFAWKIYVFSQENEIIMKARDWMEPIAKKFSEPTYIDTYASLLFKLGNIKDAIKWEKKAIREQESIDVEEDDDLLHYQLQLERFQSGL